MLATTKVKMSDSEKKVNRNNYNISSIMCDYDVSGRLRCSRAKKKNGKKSVYTLKLFQFLFIRPNVFLGCLRCRRRQALHDFIFCLSKL